MQLIDSFRKHLQLAINLLLLLLVLTGCSTPVPGMRIEEGVLINRTGLDLHAVTLWGEMWTHGQWVWIEPCTIGDWPSGESLHMHYRIEAVDSLIIKGRCREGSLEAQWP